MNKNRVLFLFTLLTLALVTIISMQYKSMKVVNRTPYVLIYKVNGRVFQALPNNMVPNDTLVINTDSGKP